MQLQSKLMYFWYYDYIDCLSPMMYISSMIAQDNHCLIMWNKHLVFRQLQCKPSSNINNERQLEEKMAPLLGSLSPATDDRLVSAVRDLFIEYPRPYLTKFSLPITQTPQAQEVDTLLHGKVINYSVTYLLLWWGKIQSKLLIKHFWNVNFHGYPKCF